MTNASNDDPGVSQGSYPLGDSPSEHAVWRAASGVNAPLSDAVEQPSRLYRAAQEVIHVSTIAMLTTVLLGIVAIVLGFLAIATVHVWSHV